MAGAWSALLLTFVSNSLSYQDSTENREPTPLTAPDPLSQAVRKSRDLLVGVPSSIPPILTEAPGAPPRVTSVHSVHPRPVPELPVSHVDTIIHGKVISISSRLLESGRGIYTEYHLSVTQMLKAPAASIADNVLDVVTVGGAIKTADGRVFRHVSRGLGKPIEIGREYLMFLNYVDAAQCFRVLKIWEVRDGRMVATAHDDVARVTLGSPTVNNLDLAGVTAKIAAVMGLK